jgi:hypothetical protein
LQDFDSIHKRVIILGAFSFSFFPSSSAIYPLSWESSLTPRFVIGQFPTLANGGDIRTPKKLHLLSSMFEEAGVSIGSHALSLCPAPPPPTLPMAWYHTRDSIVPESKIEIFVFQWICHSPEISIENWQNSLTFPPHRKARHEPCRQHVLMYIHIVPKELQ